MRGKFARIESDFVKARGSHSTLRVSRTSASYCPGHSLKGIALRGRSLRLRGGGRVSSARGHSRKSGPATREVIGRMSASRGQSSIAVFSTGLIDVNASAFRHLALLARRTRSGAARIQNLAAARRSVSGGPDARAGGTSLHRAARYRGRATRASVRQRGVCASRLIRVKSWDLAAVGVRGVPRAIGVRDGQPRLADGRVVDVANVIWCTGLIRDSTGSICRSSQRTVSRSTTAVWSMVSQDCTS
jgi:hypothetical protein